MSTSTAQVASTLDALELAQTIKALPPLPTVAHEILQRFGDEFIDGNEVADIVGRDPAISARLIALSNSAYFGLPEPVTEMRDVVNRVLGPDTVRSIAFALATERNFNLTVCDGFDARVYWQRALSVAASAQRIAAVVEDLSDDGRNFAYIAGLCHSLGLMALAGSYPEQTSAALSRADGSAGSVDHELTQTFGVTAATMTHALAEHWKMPDVIVEAYRKRAVEQVSSDMLAAVINAAVKAARHLEVLEAEESDDAAMPGFADDLPGTSERRVAEVAAPSERQQEAMAATLDAMAPK